MGTLSALRLNKSTRVYITPGYTLHRGNRDFTTQGKLKMFYAEFNL